MFSSKNFVDSVCPKPTWGKLVEVNNHKTIDIGIRTDLQNMTYDYLVL